MSQAAPKEDLAVLAMRVAADPSFRVLKLPPASLPRVEAGSDQGARPALAITVCPHSRAIGAVPFAYSDDGSILESAEAYACWNPWDEEPTRDRALSELKQLISISKMVVSDNARDAHPVVSAMCPEAAKLPWGCLSSLPWDRMEASGRDLVGWASSVGLFFSDYNVVEMARSVVGILDAADLRDETPALAYIRADLKQPWFRMWVMHPSDGDAAAALKKLGFSYMQRSELASGFSIAMPKAEAEDQGATLTGQVDSLGLASEWVSIPAAERYRSS